MKSLGRFGGGCHIRAVLLIIAAVVLAACGGEPAEAEADEHAGEPAARSMTFSGKRPINIVATTGMVADLARNVGGGLVAVTALMGEGTDPHLYKASPGDVATLRGADLILYSGLHLEGRMADMLVRLARQQPTFAVTEKLDESLLREPPEMQGQHDPHVWFNVEMWSRCAEFVRDVLKEFDPVNAEAYQKNAETYLVRLAALHEYARAGIAAISSGRRLLVTAHDAFGYFGEAYGIEVLAIQGISTESEAGVQKINQLVETIAGRGVKAVFVESSVSDKNMMALIEGCRARGHEVTIGGSLFSDAMGRAGTPEGTYEGMVRHNVDTIAGALK